MIPDRESMKRYHLLQFLVRNDEYIFHGTLFPEFQQVIPPRSVGHFTIEGKHETTLKSHFKLKLNSCYLPFWSKWYLHIPTIAFDISFEKFIEWPFVLKFIQHPRIMVIRYTGILRISNDVNDLWKVILTSFEFSTEEIKIRLQNRVVIPKASVHSVRFS